MGEVKAPTGAKEVCISAVVIRKDGSREDLGRVAYWRAGTGPPVREHKNPVKRAANRVRNMIKEA